MKTLTGYLIVCLLFLFFTSLQAQEVPAVLKEGDVEHFIETFHPLENELDALGHNFDMGEEEEDEEEDEDATDPMAAFTNMRAKIKIMMSEDEVLTVLNKYDWDENFFNIYIAVSMGYYVNKMNNEMEKMDESEKEMAKPFMDMILDQMKMMVHDKDILMIQDHMTALDVVFEEMEGQD